MNRIKFPKHCTDAELESILANAEARGYEFPYSREENRYLRVGDYQAEWFLRKHDAKAKAVKKNEELETFFSLFYLHNPDLCEAFKTAVKKCRDTDKPVPLDYGDTAADRQEVLSVLVMSHFRAALRRYAKCSALASATEQIWLLPEAMSAYEWVFAEGGFVKITQLKREFPRVLNLCERLAEATHKSPARYASEIITDSENLYQVVRVLSVYPRYYTLEQLFRVEFAFGAGNYIAARTLIVNPPEFISFTSPVRSLQPSGF